MAKYFAGLLAVLAIASGVTAYAYDHYQEATRTSDGTEVSSGPAGANEIRLAADQVVVRGTVGAMRIEGAVLDPMPLPITITTPEPGAGGATIKGVTVDGTRAELEWNAGRPFELGSIAGSFVFGPSALEVALEGATVYLGENPHSLAAGTYTLNTPVAVGTGSTARPADRVTFDAAATGVALTFRGDAGLRLGQGPYHAHGPGAVSLQGRLLLTRPDGTSESVANVTLDNGPFDLRLTRNAETGFDIEITLQGNVVAG